MANNIDKKQIFFLESKFKKSKLKKKMHWKSNYKQVICVLFQMIDCIKNYLEVKTKKKFFIVLNFKLIRL